MPSSDPRVIESVCRQIIIENPKSVLDIGVGFGKWGMLAREYTDIWNYRFYKKEWITAVHGIEVHEKYRNPIWDIYDHITIGDAADILASGIWHKAFDLVLMIDVLEHFEKEKGKTLIKDVMTVTDKFVVSYCNTEQKDVRDNKYEDHVSTWEDEDFKAYERRLLTGGPGWGVYLLWNK